MHPNDRRSLGRMRRSALAAARGRRGRVADSNAFQSSRRCIVMAMHFNTSRRRIVMAMHPNERRGGWAYPPAPNHIDSMEYRRSAPTYRIGIIGDHWVAPARDDWR